VRREWPRTRLQGGWLLAARCGWILVAALTVSLLVIGFVVNVNRPDLIRVPSGRAVMANAGLPDQLSNVAILAILTIFAGTGILIFWRRSADPAAMLFGLLLVTGCMPGLRTEWAPERVMPWLEQPVRLVWIILAVLITIVFSSFPTAGSCPAGPYCWEPRPFP
jgi:hypothetical protein